MKKPKCKMSMENRAKQFLSFAALGGLEEALKEKEIIKQEQYASAKKKSDESDEYVTASAPQR